MAGKTMVVSLPAFWVKKFGIKKGDEIDLNEVGSQIIISQKKSIQMEGIKIDLRGHDSFVKRNLNVLYREGYDRIEVLYDDSKIVEDIQETIDTTLPGFEILTQTSKGCVIKSIANPEESEFDSTLRRLFLITLSMGNESLEAVLKNKLSDLDKIKKKEITNNKLSNHCQRFLNKRGYENFKKTTHMYSVVRLLEQIADEYRDLCVYLLQNNIKLSKNTVSFYDKTNKFFELIYNLFYKFNRKKLMEEKEMRFAMLKEFQGNAAKMSCKELIVNHHLVNILNNGHHMTDCFDYLAIA